MRRLSLLAALLLPAAASARPSLSLRLGYAPAVGSVAADVPVQDGLAAQLPLQLDALWRFGPLSAGAYGSWGLGRSNGEACGDGADCGGSAVRVGVEGLYALDARLAGATPWVGAGIGWEWIARTRERLGSETVWGWNGLEALVQAGAAWHVGRRYSLGPYALVAVGRYATESLETSAASASAPVEDRALHAWIHLGVRGTVDL
jgi:hypothetical protein